MTDIQTWQPQTVAPTTTSLVQWAQEADAAYSLAQRLCATSFCPEQFRGKPVEAAAAMLAGTELGFSPLTALSAFDVIQGRAAARAITLRALVQSKGHDIVLVESTDTRCRMKGRRANSQEWQSVTWTIDQARTLGLTNKSNWKNQPGTMLIARATSAICRLVASDAILGLGGGYSSEEIHDGAGPDVVAVAATEPATTRRMSRPVRVEQTEPADEAPAEGVEALAEPTEPTPAASDESGLTQPQQRKMMAQFKQLGIEDRDDRLNYASGIVGRDLASSSDLTKAEAVRVIDALERDGAK